ncbi:hypothetical protein T12_1667, partial [Trichinella patagoniensis]
LFLFLFYIVAREYRHDRIEIFHASRMQNAVYVEIGHREPIGWIGYSFNRWFDQHDGERNGQNFERWHLKVQWSKWAWSTANYFGLFTSVFLSIHLWINGEESTYLQMLIEKQSSNSGGGLFTTLSWPISCLLDVKHPHGWPKVLIGKSQVLRIDQSLAIILDLFSSFVNFGWLCELSDKARTLKIRFGYGHFSNVPVFMYA